MKRTPKIVSAALLALLVGCVVIPDTFEARIYIDIRHIEQQADGFLDYVEGKTEALPDFDAPTPDQNSWLQNTMDFLAPVQVAYAAEELNDSSPRVKQIADSMKSRHNDVGAAKRSGAIGENNRGLLELLDTSALSTDEAVNEMQRLLAAENEDRKALYKEIARLNREQNVSVSVVERVYAQKRFERAESGEKVQLPAAGEDFDKARDSAVGRKLGSQCVPEAWVTIP